MSLYLSHIRLEKNPSAKALASLLRPSDTNERISAQHHLLWSVFADSEERKRDFLWREERDGSFLTLSERPPLQTDLFQPHQVKPYAPELVTGDQLEFLLRVNATRMKRGDNRARVDVVMDALHHIDKSERAAHRQDIATREGHLWLARQGEKNGFEVLHARADDYSVVALPRPGKGRHSQIKLGILDLSGTIQVKNPVLFIQQLRAGFGRAKSFGCGLMLLRRL